MFKITINNNQKNNKKTIIFMYVLMNFKSSICIIDIMYSLNL